MRDYIITYGQTYHYLWSSTLVLLMYVASVYMICIEGKTYIAGKKMFIAVPVLSILSIHFPMTFMLIYKGMSLVNSADPKYAYLSISSIKWLMFLPFVTAVGSTLFLCSIKSKNKWKYLCASILILFVLWGFGRRLPDWERELNRKYRIPNKTIEIAEYIREEKGEQIDINKDYAAKVLIISAIDRDAILSGQGEDYDIYTYIQWGVGRSLRQYISSVEVEYVELSAKDKHTMDDSLGVDKICKYDYIICNCDNYVCRELVNNGFDIVMRDDTLLFFKRIQ